MHSFATISMTAAIGATCQRLAPLQPSQSWAVQSTLNSAVSTVSAGYSHDTTVVRHFAFDLACGGEAHTELSIDYDGLLWLQTGGGGNYSSRAEQLDLKEKELNAREAELKQREEELRRAGGLTKKKNWPRCYPIAHHDIAGDVSPNCWLQNICRSLL